MVLSCEISFRLLKYAFSPDNRSIDPNLNRYFLMMIGILSLYLYSFYYLLISTTLLFFYKPRIIIKFSVETEFTKFMILLGN